MGVTIKTGYMGLSVHIDPSSDIRTMWLACLLSLLLGVVVLCQIAVVIIFYSSRNIQIVGREDHVLDENISLSPEASIFEDEEDFEDYGEGYDQFIRYRNQDEYLLDGCATHAMKEI